MQGFFFFFKWNLLSCYSTRALQFTKQQVHLDGSQHEELRVNYKDRVFLDPASKFRPRLPYTELVVLLERRFLCNFIHWLKNLTSEDVVFSWGFVHHVKIVIVKNKPVVDNFVKREMVDLQATIYQA